jgi:hypothetical protein
MCMGIAGGVPGSSCGDHDSAAVVMLAGSADWCEVAAAVAAVPCCAPHA